MFKLLSEIFRKEDQLQQAYNTTLKMLKFEEKMFQVSYKSLAHDLAVDGMEQLDVYATDRDINEYQREVRRKVVAHLATSTSRDIVFGLILVSIIVDVERIGDYAKNIQDLARNHPQPLDYYQYKTALKEVEQLVSKRFTKLIFAFEKQDDAIAHELMVGHKHIKDVCDAIVDELVQDTSGTIPANDAVTLALYARYLKRISAHTTNVASSMVNSFENIGFKQDLQDI